MSASFSESLFHSPPPAWNASSHRSHHASGHGSSGAGGFAWNPHATPPNTCRQTNVGGVSPCLRQTMFLPSLIDSENRPIVLRREGEPPGCALGGTPRDRNAF